MDLEQKVARNKQHHTCEIRHCLVMDKGGRFVCKQRAPFETANEDFIHENGHWGMKRLYEFINAWVPAIAVMIPFPFRAVAAVRPTSLTLVSFFL